jgi:uncharacterized protein with ParB-like and HNH nuclease domain
MDFYAESFRLETIFSGDRIYEIPDYQREYCWEKEQLNDFWDDLNSKLSIDLFFGIVVLEGKDFKNLGGDFIVIDEQQRLTTISLLINRIINKLENIKEETLALKLKERLLFSDDDGKRSVRMENKNSHAFFQKIVFHNEELDSSEKENIEAFNLINAKNFFQEKIKNYNKDQLRELRDKLFKVLLIIVAQETRKGAFKNETKKFS